MYYRDLPPVTGEDDDGYANQGYDRAAHVKHLRTAHEHAAEAARCLRRALDMLDAEDETPDPGDVDPMEFDDDVDANPEGRAHGRARYPEGTGITVGGMTSCPSHIAGRHCAPLGASP
jgi:hypothetical protein